MTLKVEAIRDRNNFALIKKHLTLAFYIPYIIF
jgi:hypothetical protein